MVREALEAGAKVGIIAGTCSTPEERIADAALAALGPGMAERLNVYVLGESMVADEDKTSAPGQELSLERQFANAQAKVTTHCSQIAPLVRCPSAYHSDNHG